MCLLFLVVGAGDLETNGPAEHLFERAHVPVRGPELELGVAVGAEPCEVVVAARVEIDPGDGLRVAAIEPFGQPHHRRQLLDRPAAISRKIPVSLVRLLRRRLPMIARDERNHLDLLRLEAAEVAVLDQVVRMPVVALVADVHADIVQQRAVFEPLALACRQSVDAARLVEDAQREPGDLLRVLRPVAAALAQLDDAAATDVRVAIDLADPRAVAVDVVDDQTFAQREIAERELVGARRRTIVSKRPTRRH